jgi:hypothetical protein
LAAVQGKDTTGLNLCAKLKTLANTDCWPRYYPKLVRFRKPCKCSETGEILAAGDLVVFDNGKTYKPNTKGAKNALERERQRPLCWL